VGSIFPITSPRLNAYESSAYIRERKMKITFVLCMTLRIQTQLNDISHHYKIILHVSFSNLIIH